MKKIGSILLMILVMATLISCAKKEINIQTSNDSSKTDSVVVTDSTKVDSLTVDSLKASN